MSLISEKELAQYRQGNSLIDQLTGLFNHQKDNWDLAKTNYSGLDSVKKRSLQIDGEEVLLQFNPHRVISTTADVSEKTVSNRKCILCKDNLPEEQKYLNYYKEYLFLVNPYPILREHFTIAKTKHIPQKVSTYLNDILLISRDVGERYFVFYNGAKCGASLPEHLHFQMGTKDDLPLYHNLIKGDKSKNKVIVQNRRIKITTLTSQYRSAIVAESRESIELLNLFSMIVSTLKKTGSSIFDDEPLFNIVSFNENKVWTLVIFLRKKHRPSVYFKQGKDQIIISPASIDMSGLVILPREEDYQKITAQNLMDVYREVSLCKEMYEYLILQLKNFYNGN